MIKPWLDENLIEAQLSLLGYTLRRPKHLAEAILRLSDFYIDQPSEQTPWKEKWAQAAYLSYFHPLNSERIARVVEHGKKENFFSGFQNLIDYGSGLGAGSSAVLTTYNLKTTYIESSQSARQLHQAQTHQASRSEWLSSDRDLQVLPNTLAIFSYSLTELEKLPKWADQCAGLMLVEPASGEDARKLLQLRQNLIEKHWQVWAPCRHQQACPLLTHSKRDWCHDRVHFQRPAWFLNIENELPIKNNTLTMSYLLLKKTPPIFDANLNARLTGDLLDEKGKSRMLVCRGPDREFLAWLHRNGPAPDLKRGDLFGLNPLLPKKGDEIRNP